MLFGSDINEVAGELLALDLLSKCPWLTTKIELNRAQKEESRNNHGGYVMHRSQIDTAIGEGRVSSRSTRSSVKGLLLWMSATAPLLARLYSLTWRRWWISEKMTTVLPVVKRCRSNRNHIGQSKQKTDLSNSTTTSLTTIKHNR
jgi:hypothetical protein